MRLGQRLDGVTPNHGDDFEEHRSLLLGIAYRMLGTVADAEDVVQESYLRWCNRPDTEVESAKAYLVAVVVRLCIDELRSARARRVTYMGPWLPEPIVVDADPAWSAELADSLSMAFLVLLERLSPRERATLLLHDVFGYGYDEISRIMRSPEAACRKTASRARQRLGDRPKPFDSDIARGREITEEFVVACGTGNVDRLLQLLADDVVLWTDGGGVVRAAPQPVRGSHRAARFLVNVSKSLPSGINVRHLMLNGQPGAVIEEEGVVSTAIVLDITDGRAVGVRIVTNPHKLTHLQYLAQRR